MSNLVDLFKIKASVSSDCLGNARYYEVMAGKRCMGTYFNSSGASGPSAYEQARERLIDCIEQFIALSTKQIPIDDPILDPRLEDLEDYLWGLKKEAGHEQ